MEYYLHCECPRCGKDVYELCANFTEHNGLPIFDLDGNCQTSMDCECGCSFGTGDIEVIDFNEA